MVGLVSAERRERASSSVPHVIHVLSILLCSRKELSHYNNAARLHFWNSNRCSYNYNKGCRCTMLSRCVSL